MDAPVFILAAGNDWPSDAFAQTVLDARAYAAQAPDDAIRYMAHAIPIYIMAHVTPELAAAGNAPGALFRGLCTDEWPGLGKPEHGMVWLFEDGNRASRAEFLSRAEWDALSPADKLLWVTYETLTHEFAHALQRDHVLDAMERQGWRPQTAGCG